MSKYTALEIKIAKLIVKEHAWVTWAGKDKVAQEDYLKTARKIVKAVNKEKTRKEPIPIKLDKDQLTLVIKPALVGFAGLVKSLAGEPDYNIVTNKLADLLVENYGKWPKS